MPAKSILISKTFWVQVAAVLTALLPPVTAWLQANPVEFVAALAAVNVLVRFVTSGRISIFAAGGSKGTPSGGAAPLGLLVTLAAAGACGLLPSCSAADYAALRAMPIRACVVTARGTVCYSAKGGMEIAVDATK